MRRNNQMTFANTMLLGKLLIVSFSIQTISGQHVSTVPTLGKLITFSILHLLPVVYGTGHLWIPPQRSSMWRAGYNVPVNYNDMVLNCGGYYNQWSVNSGRCGACGDAYQGPYQNDKGGRYVTGTIGGVYNQCDTISLTVNLTAYQRGFFQFRLCDDGSLTGDKLQECFNCNMLTLKTPKGRSDKFYPDKREALYTIPAILPDCISCDHCVLQWEYTTGNHWGSDAQGTGLGHGPQGHYVNCADIKIKPVQGCDNTVEKK